MAYFEFLSIWPANQVTTRPLGILRMSAIHDNMPTRYRRQVCYLAVVKHGKLYTNHNWQANVFKKWKAIINYTAAGASVNSFILIQSSRFILGQQVAISEKISPPESSMHCAQQPNFLPTVPPPLILCTNISVTITKYEVRRPLQPSTKQQSYSTSALGWHFTSDSWLGCTLWKAFPSDGA
jgi:hypothetical protein